jgi:hypothetical protein
LASRPRKADASSKQSSSSGGVLDASDVQRRSRRRPNNGGRASNVLPPLESLTGEPVDRFAENTAGRFDRRLRGCRKFLHGARDTPSFAAHRHVSKLHFCRARDMREARHAQRIAPAGYRRGADAKVRERWRNRIRGTVAASARATIPRTVRFAIASAATGWESLIRSDVRRAPSKADDRGGQRAGRFKDARLREGSGGSRGMTLRSTGVPGMARLSGSKKLPVQITY